VPRADSVDSFAADPDSPSADYVPIKPLDKGKEKALDGEGMRVRDKGKGKADVRGAEVDSGTSVTIDGETGV
jgi:hypothetical protein